MFEEFVDEETRALAGGQIIQPKTMLQRLEVRTLSSSDVADRVED